MKRNHSIGLAFSICLICVFSILSALLIYMGNEDYRQIIKNEELNKTYRTTISYLSSKVKTADSVDGIALKDKNGIKVLSVSDNECETLIYYYDNCIYEVYMGKEDEFTPLMGNIIAKVQGYDVNIDNGKVTFKVQDGKKEFTVSVALNK